MTIALAHITFDAAHPQGLAGFWSAALGIPVDEGSSEWFASIDDADPDRPSWFFVKIPEGKSTKNRVHVDLTADDRDAEVDRLIAAGATKLSQHDEWGASWTVMVDPENNEFCVGQKPGER
jgi:predicted enzyme related to lactoylglutathione lyase